jgi:hypothetical protein
MRSFFISYRKDDAPSAAYMIDERIGQRFGESRSFLDYHDIPVGEDFRPRLWNALDDSIALIAVIGTRWLGADENGAPSIMRDSDFVRREVAHALSKKIPVIPVLVEGGRLPLSADLPDDIRDIVNWQYVTLNRRSLGGDLASLLDRLAPLVGPAGDSAPVQPTAPVAPGGIGSVKARRIGNLFQGTTSVGGNVYGGDYVGGDVVGRDKNVHLPRNGNDPS